MVYSLEQQPLDSATFSLQDSLWINLTDSNTLKLSDSINFESRFIEKSSDLHLKNPINLLSPSNINTIVRYDYKKNRYVFENRVGNKIISTPFSMSPEEYREYRLRKSQIEFFKERNSLNYEAPKSGRKFTLPNRQKNSMNLESIFGTGGVQVTTSGYIEVSAGIKKNTFNNPTLPQRARRRSMFDFDQDINLTMNAKVGNKVNFDINYNSNTSFDIGLDSKEIKLAYKGDEDEIIKNIEAGNVNMTTTNSLINTGGPLFGVKADLQFGKLHLNTVFSRQLKESEALFSQDNSYKSIEFEINADQYDANRHFFLGQYFREVYDKALSKLPFVQSKVTISRIEVWVTNRRGDYRQIRNIVALADLGEHDRIGNDLWSSQGSLSVTHNGANNLYGELISSFSGARNLNDVESIFPNEMIAGMDYQKLENARLLSESDYKLQPQLGYLSLNTQLQDDEVLAVAFEFMYDGDVYMVGEFTNNIESSDSQNGSDSVVSIMSDKLSDALFVKLLKPVSFSPHSYTWDLMMKNIYSLGFGAYDVQKEGFKLNVSYLSDSTGIYLNYINDAGLYDRLLLNVMSLDRLNSKNDPYPDGIFDFIDGYTINTAGGYMIFPVVEPFGSHLQKEIGDDQIAEKYVFRELYDSTLTVAQQFPEKNRFRLRGEYRSSTGSVLNDDIFFMGHTQRRTLMGVNFLYDINRNLSVGGTIMHYYEKPMIVKTMFGYEAAKNTLLGTNLSYRNQSFVITNLLNKLPFVEATSPSSLSADLEFAHMLPGHYENKHIGEYSYLDDFESSTSGIDIRNPYSWTLASTPFNNSSSGLFPEASLSNDVEYGNNRAQFAWFYIDGIFTRRNSGLTPAHIKNDIEQLSNHLVRDVYEREVFPNRDAYFGLPSTIPVLNISFYPHERGPYNLDSEVDSEGHLLNPRNRWGGIMRKMDTNNFEAANIEYIEFWLMDPFVNDTTGRHSGGDLYINLGNISEDILKDGKKFYENGLPIDGDTTAFGYSVWGKYPKRQSTVYAFDNSGDIEVRRLQDVGLNGLSTEEEFDFPTYSNFIEELKQNISGETLRRMEDDDHSPLNDPAGDNFRHYRGAIQDRQQLSILDRYKYFNGSEGNSTNAEEDRFSGAARTTPDVEDINNDNTMSEHESYYQYRVSLQPGLMEVGSNYIVDKRVSTVRLRNGNDSKVTWYQFKIPIRGFESRIGNIRGFNNIRFMRLFLTGFEEPVFLRFATLELVRSEWRSYQRDLLSSGELSGTGSIDVSVVNVEENGSRTPINYVLPPGVSRVIDPGQPQLRKENEQSLSLRVTDLESGDARAVYKNSAYDLRRYKQLQMFVHAELLNEDLSLAENGDLTIFMRLGTDYRNNYYEYEIPLRFTPEGSYSAHNNDDREAVWPMENMFNFPLDLFTSLKLSRSRDEVRGIFRNRLERFTRHDPAKPDNIVTIVGNPSLADVKVIMIGVRNISGSIRSAEVWVNELRLSEFDESGGWAAQANVNLTLSDIGSINFSGRKETAGFGAIDDGLQQRRNDEFDSYSFVMNFELGRFLPKELKVIAPLYYSYMNQFSTPLYDPFNTDLLLEESLDLYRTLDSDKINNLEKMSDYSHLVDSIRDIAVTRWENRSLTLNNVKMDIKSRWPMPYDPANFSFTYAHNMNQRQSPETEYSTMTDWRLNVSYDYSPKVDAWEPFRSIHKTSKLLGFVNLNLLPDNIKFSSDISRNYQQMLFREIGTLQLQDQNPAENQKLLTFSSNFYWDRDFSINWNISNNLLFSFRSGTLAEIEEPYLQVDRKINHSDYEIWKDSVKLSISELGKPLNYEQTANVTYNFPFSRFDRLKWINASAAYNSRYRWERGAFITDEKIGNYLYNDLSFTFNGRINFASLNNWIPIKNIGMNMSIKRRTDVPGYAPMIGDLYGQNNSYNNDGLLPGIGFAFGLDGGREFIEKSLSNNLLIINDENINPALFNETKNLRLDASIEPFRGLNIRLNMLHEDNRRSEFYFMMEGIPNRTGGSFAMTTISLASAFENSTRNNNYHSSSFDMFLNNRAKVAERVKNDNINSADVLIPAFLAAYTGKSAEKVVLSPFPNLKSMLPNWEVSYNAFSIYPILQDMLQSLTFNHRYISQYRIGSYSSGYTSNTMKSDQNLSSFYIIPSVNITQSFNPLIEVRSELHNNLIVNIRVNKTKGVNLNISSYQIVETNDKDLEVGLGYKFREINFRLDFSQKTTTALIRKIEDGFTQATSGLKTASIRFTADYSISRSLTLKTYYDRMMNRPLVSSYSYPTSNSNAGVSLRINFNK